MHKRINKTLGILLALVLILSQSIIAPVYAADIETDTVLTIDDAEATVGESFQVAMRVEKSDPFAATTFKLDFDPDVFELTGVALHPTLSPSQGAKLTTTPAGLGVGTFLFEYDPQAAFDDGPIFFLTFLVKEGAASGLYTIGFNEEMFFGNNALDTLLPKTFNSGTITVTAPDGQAEYNNLSYATVQDAINAAGNTADAMITLLKSFPVEASWTIPAGADITLDLKGKTITADFEGGHLIEVKEGGKLHLTSTGQDRGKFVYEDRPDYSDDAPSGLSFLMNEGTLNMSRIEVVDFWQGVVDGQYPDYAGLDPDLPFESPGAGGTIGTIEDCEFDTVFTAIGLGASDVEALSNCLIVADAHPVAFGFGMEGITGTVNLIDNSAIFTRRKSDALSFGSLFLAMNGKISEIRDTVLANHNEATGNNGSGALVNEGTINKITSSSSVKFTRIEAPVIALANDGTIGLIESGHTKIKSAERALVVGWYGDDGTVTEISGGLFQGGSQAIDISEGQNSIGKISGGIFESDNGEAIDNAGSIDKVSGGVFTGKTGALVGAGGFTGIEAGYYKADEGNEALSSKAKEGIVAPYGLSTHPLKSGTYKDYYHVGTAVTITWHVEGKSNQVDTFIQGDPVYYVGEIPEAPDGKYFKAWGDGTQEYGPSQLPIATANTTYTALFGDEKDPKDYEVIVESLTEHANRGDEFTVDVKVTSVTNETFFGATVEVEFDSSKLTFQGDKIADNPFNVQVSSLDSNKLRISGAYLEDEDEPEGFAIVPDTGYLLAKLSFKVKNDIETGTTDIEIMDKPVVDQLEVFDSKEVEKGEDLTVNLWNLKVTFKSGDNVASFEKIAYVKYDQAGLYEDTDYDSNFGPPTPVANDWHTLDEPLWKPEEGENVDYSTIVNEKFTGDATYTANASPSKYDISYEGDFVAILTGVDNDGKVTYLTAVTFKVTANSGYQVKTVTYKVNDGDPVLLEADSNGVYTIEGGNIKGDITIEFAEEVDAKVILHSNDDYHALPSGYQLLELQVSNKLAEGKAYAYKEEGPMFYSPKYSEEDEEFNPNGWHVYLFAIPTKDGEGNAITEADVPALLSIIDETCEVLDYAYDINQDGRVNSTDVVLTYGFYKGVHLYNGFSPATMKVRLNADVTGDRAVDTQDATAILSHIWTTPY